MMRYILVLFAFAAIVCASEVEDVEQKKRGAGKPTSLNAIPTGAQKPEYTYSIYSQNPQSSPPSQYQPQVSYPTQVPNSFYPSQGNNQYYTSSNSPPDSSQIYQQQPQLNLLPPQPSPAQFVPLNFLPNPGFQSRYQIIPSKSSNGNIQLAVIPQQSQVVPYSQPYFSPSPGNHQGPLLSPLPSQNQFTPNYQPFGNPYIGHPSTMVLLAHPNPSLYNNIYSNPLQSFYNYYPSNSQAKYSLSYGSSPSPPSVEYEKVQGPVPQAKEDNDIGAHGAEYITQPDSSGSYKNYASSRSSSYSKL